MMLEAMARLIMGPCMVPCHRLQDAAKLDPSNAVSWADASTGYCPCM